MYIEQESEEWKNTLEQKIWIIMKVWAEIQFNFVYFNQVPELDWEKEIRESLPKILETDNIDDFYISLQEVIARLKDGHTMLLPPMIVLESIEHPALEFQMIENKIDLLKKQ